MCTHEGSIGCREREKSSMLCYRYNWVNARIENIFCSLVLSLIHSRIQLVAHKTMLCFLLSSFTSFLNVLLSLSSPLSIFSNRKINHMPFTDTINRIKQQNKLLASWDNTFRSVYMFVDVHACALAKGEKPLN